MTAFTYKYANRSLWRSGADCRTMKMSWVITLNHLIWLFALSTTRRVGNYKYVTNSALSWKIALRRLDSLWCWDTMQHSGTLSCQLSGKRLAVILPGAMRIEREEFPSNFFLFQKIAHPGVVCIFFINIQRQEDKKGAWLEENNRELGFNWSSDYLRRSAIPKLHNWTEVISKLLKLSQI